MKNFDSAVKKILQSQICPIRALLYRFISHELPSLLCAHKETYSVKCMSKLKYEYELCAEYKFRKQLRFGNRQKIKK